MNKHRFARLVSFAFHPVVFAILVPFLIVYKETASVLYGLKWAFISSFFLFVAGGLFFILRPKTVVNDMDEDFDIAHKENRHMFYSIAALFAVLYLIVSLIFKGIFFPLSIVALGILLGIIFFDLLTYYIKASVHAAIVTAYSITFGMLYGFLPFLGVVWTLFLVIWSRLYLKKHTNTEILAGIIGGALITLATIFISRQLVP